MPGLREPLFEVDGVARAKPAGMAGIGIAKGGDAELLAQPGADIVVPSIDHVRRAAEGRLEVRPRL